jgi:hypothetical protein
LLPIDTLDLGGPIIRLAGDQTGALAGYGFALAGKSVLAFVPRAPLGGPIGSLAVPTPTEPRWLAVDASTRTLLVSDGNHLFAATLRPE